MDFSIAETKNRLPELVRAVEAGKTVIITRHGKRVAQLTGPPSERRTARLGEMKGRIKLLPGWDEPLGIDSFIDDDE